MESVYVPQGRQHAGPWRLCRGTVALGLLAAVIFTACGSGTPSSTSTSKTTSTTGSTAPIDHTLGHGVSASSIRMGVALVDFAQIARFTDTIRTNAEQRQIYQIFFDDLNAHGGINGRKIVPIYKFYTPLGTAGILALCTGFAQDDNVFAVVGTFVDFSGQAQTCIANQERRVLMTFNLTQAIANKSPAGLIATAGSFPERSASILIQLLVTQHTLAAKTVAVLGDTTESTVVNDTIVPALQHAGVKLGSTAVLDVGTTGDFTAASAQLNSFMEKWKTEGVNAVFLSGDLASTKPFVEPIKKAFPHLLLMADNTDTLLQAQQLQQAGLRPNPYEGLLTAGGLTGNEYDNSANWQYCAAIYQKATGTPAPDAEHTIKLPNGKIDDTHGTITDACATLTMFRDIVRRAGPYLNDASWIESINHFGPITNRGSGPYSSFRTGKYSAEDTWRLQAYDSSLGNTGLWKPVTPLENITGG
jgi:ABC-type branched-subunit amino acid transport system substrate-binding protein